MINARHLALTILQAVEDRNRTLDHWLSQHAADIDVLSRADRALLHMLVYGVLRWQLRLDWYIDKLSRKPGKKIDALVRIILRMALYQLIYLDRIPPSAAVNTAVNLAKTSGRPWAAGFINAVLRRASVDVLELFEDIDHNNPASALSVQYSFPSWMLSRWIHRFGIAETESLCKAVNTVPDITIRANTLLTTRNELVTAIADRAASVVTTAYSPEGISFRTPRETLSQWDAFGKGWFQVQDEAAQLVSHLLAPQPGEMIWDACAGLGTKTAHLAQLMNNQGRIVATDQHASKLDQLGQEMKRLGIIIVETRRLDLLSASPPLNLPRFDRILLDAPCSGIGVLQKNPDGKWRISSADLKRYGQRQLELLNNVAPFLKPAGILVYAVCSIEPEENGNVVKQFLADNDAFQVQQPELRSIFRRGALTTPHGCLYTLPHRHHMDGFFAVTFKRKE